MSGNKKTRPMTNRNCELIDDTTRGNTCSKTEHNINDTKGKRNVNAGINFSVPIDRGWAWVILLGSMLQMTLTIGFQKASGILFVEFQQRFNSTSSTTSLLSTVQNAAYSVSAPAIMTIGVKLTSLRCMTVIGSIIMTSSCIISAYANRIHILFCSYGVLQGIGLACTLLPSLSILGIYFSKKKGLANSLAMSGASAGGFIIAPLVTYLSNTYGYQGSLLIVGAVLLNGCVSGALFRPPSYYQKTLVRKCNLHDGEKPLITCDANTNQELGLEGSPFFKPKTREGPLINKSEHTTLVDKIPITETANFPEQLKCFINTDQKCYDTDSPAQSSAKDLNMCSSLYTTDIIHTRDPRVSVRRTSRIKDILRTFLVSFDFKLFRNPLFNMLLVIAVNICPGSLLASIFLAPYAKDNDISSENIAVIVTVFNITDLVSRITVGVISDRGWLRRSTLVGITAIVDGLASQFVVFYSSFYLLLIYAIILGIFSGAYFALIRVILVDYLTLAKLNSSIGFLELVHGAGISLTFFLVGHIRDVTGSYIASYHLLGTMCLIGGILILLLPLLERFQERNKLTTRDV